MNLTVHRGAKHEYRETEQGVDLFSVSQIRKMAHDPNLGIPEQVLEAARHRGTVLHRRLWRLLASQAGLLPVPPATPQFAGYCTSMDEWIKRNQVMPVKIEEASCSLKFGYAGTPDALVTIGPKQFTALIDLKTGAPTKTDPMQLIAYQKMEGYEDAAYLVDVYVQADGSRAKEARITSGMKATEWAWFLNALGVLQSRVNHGCQ
jgi:hypothetical protein